MSSFTSWRTIKSQLCNLNGVEVRVVSYELVQGTINSLALQRKETTTSNRQWLGQTKSTPTTQKARHATVAGAELRCRGRSNIFPSEGFFVQSVGILKQAIYSPAKFGDILPENLTLYKVSIPDEGKTVVESKMELVGYLIPNFQRGLSMFLSSHHSELRNDLANMSPILLKRFKLESRKKFKATLDGKDVGDQVELPNIGQEPKHYGKGFQGKSFIITEQMMELWNKFSADSNRSIKRVLAGPMGVCKSSLAIFLARKAYAEGWSTLYVANAAELANLAVAVAAKEICLRSFVLNKDLLATSDLKKLLLHENSGRSHSFCRRDNFDVNGVRVVFTGTAHASYERVYISDDIEDWVEFVRPLSNNIFDKTLSLSTLPSRNTVKKEVKRVTNNVPRGR
ncbi:hypothetical protein BCR41DRAFT_396260 [Lobosporangium transversale]|uniref:Uncharacterized protein n=1 Tax=Lobosporangium transversale TaxID=64571 RepID=A0A1Y2GN41_9FUNG|nr:hypothetical protein BCR41DRAFT_396260 [Lobosporangium transversale]ORZ16118.1 hypothetical protein BCR41DRAFT_396260 [Lobosporangium transversale]|eukprot:XP_021881465.1 hypothetical protein BCR41DRAFT_396260 [Lobosporangium transversale]